VMRRRFARWSAFGALGGVLATLSCRHGSSAAHGIGDVPVAPSAESPAADSQAGAAAAPSSSAAENTSPADSDATDPTASLEALLPAVDADGVRVLALLPREMGARGVDGLAMLVMDLGGDREIEEYTLRGPAARGVRVHDGGVSAALSLINRGGWVHLAPSTVTPDTGARPHRPVGDEPNLPNVAQIGDVVLSYREPVFEVRRGSRAVLSRRVLRWSAVAPGPVCGRPWGSIEQAWIDAERRIAVGRIDYHGPSSDLCWLPDRTIHVLRWE
jgi:hypothetical protein